MNNSSVVGINDPSTPGDVIVHLGNVLADLGRQPPLSRLLARKG